MTDQRPEIMVHRILGYVMTVMWIFAGVFWALAVLVSPGAINPAVACTFLALFFGAFWIIARRENL